jgi:hypothetical protein
MISELMDIYCFDNSGGTQMTLCHPGSKKVS